MQEVILVFDVGTTNFKTILFGLDGTPRLTLHFPFRPAYGSEGMVFQDPLDWWKAVTDGSSRAAVFARENGLKIAAISLTASRSSVIPVDPAGNHIAPAMMWQETASRDIVNALNRGDALARIYACAGSRPNTVFSAPKMTWLRRQRPEVYRAAAKLVGIQDYLIHFLTGQFVTDHTFGSRTLLMDIHRREWDAEMLGLFEVDRDKLCDLIPPGSVAGTLQAGPAAMLGLSAGIPVVTAGGDQQNAALGAGVIRRGDVMVNMGTGSFLVAAVDEPVTDRKMRVMSNASALPGKCIVDAGMLTTGSVHRWFAEMFYNEFPAGNMNDRYARMDAEAAEAAPGCDGLFLLPHFSGCGAPHWENRARGAFYGLGLGHRRGDLARAVFEGVAAEVALNLAVAEELVGGLTNIRLAGGLTQGRFFCQLLADLSGREFSLAKSREATARGAWSQAMLALGRARDHAEALAKGEEAGVGETFRPNGARADLYRKFLATRDCLFASLAPMREQ